MIRLPANVLELNRTFFAFPDDAQALHFDNELVRAALMARGSTGWDALLAHPYVVVLGEAGTGKTTEFKLRVRSLREQGRFAFFVVLSNLAADGLEKSLDSDEVLRLARWREGESDAVFFLDALDEAKLRHRSLEDALRRLSHEIHDQWTRVRLVVSCRVSDWMAEADRHELRSIAPSGATDVYIVQLAPLRTEQVDQLARAAGVNDIAAFMAAVIGNHAQNFIERPLDVQWLGTYWHKHRSIKSLRDLISYNVREKLKELPGRQSTLPLTKAEAGIETLAGVATINNFWAFGLLDTSLDAQRARDAIEPQEYLPDLSAPEIEELLRRAVFDEATYGRVRFHHRSVQEYLAAKWLARLVSNGFAHSHLFALLFRGSDGEQVVPFHLQPVAAWLALWDERLRRRLILEAPSLLIEYGDPSGFSATDNGEILRSYAGQYRDRLRQFERFNRASLQRFSTPVLSEQINAMLSAAATPDELRVTLLRMVELGRLSRCADVCLILALDLSQPAEVRGFAIRSVAASGAEAQRSALLSLLQTSSEWEVDVLEEFARAMYPDMLDARGLVDLVTLATFNRTDLESSLGAVLAHDLPARGTRSQRLELLARLVDAVWVLDDGASEHSVPSPHQWLLSLVARLLPTLLDEFPDADEYPASIWEALAAFRWYNGRGRQHRHGLDEVKKVVARHPRIRRGLFWQSVEEYRQRKGSTPTQHGEIRHSYELVPLTNTDRAWLADDACSRSDVKERLLAFDALFSITAPDGDEASRLTVLRDVASGHPELGRRLERMLTPPATLQPPEIRRWDREARVRKSVENRRRAEDLAELRKCIESIRDGRNFNALLFIWENAECDIISMDAATVTASLEGTFGTELADAAIAGWRAFWRSYDPPMPHERERPKSTPYAALLGLLGLTFEFARGFNPSSLDSAEARIATRYAACALSSFPSWQADVARAHPDVVALALTPAVLADMQHPDDGTLGHYVFSKITEDDIVRGLLAPAVAAQLRTEDPPILQHLEDALDVVIREKVIDVGDFAELARRRCRANNSTPERFVLWWDGWLSQDADGALALLEELLGEVRPEVAYDFVLGVCERIYRVTERYATRPWLVREQPSVLKRLIPLVHEHIKPEDDVERRGVFTPGRRDNAQIVRNRLISWISNVPGTEGVDALRELAEDSRLASSRDWLLHLADQRRVADAAQVSPEVVTALTELCRTHGSSAPENLGELTAEKNMVKILFLAANPLFGNQLALDEEFRSIQQQLRSSPRRDSFDLKSQWAIRPTDLQQALLEECPTIVHFSGHGSEGDGLVFHSRDAGVDSRVSAAALRLLFRVLKDNVRVIVLNACFSQEQAMAVVEEIDFVVGMSQSVNDLSARLFAVAFYRALAFGRSVQDAFDSGIAELQLNEMADADVPRLLVRDGVSAGMTKLV